MKNILLLLILFIVTFSFAETYRGYVYDQEHNPLQEVLIIHGQNSTFSQENGFFLLNSKSKADSLLIYYAFHEVIKINKNDFTVPRDFTLIPLDIEMNTFTFTSKKSNNQLPGSQEKITISLKDKKSENTNLAQVLTEDKSIQIQGAQLPGERQTASILGHSSRHTLVMLDGLPLNNNGEDFDLASIPVELVEEVEIYKNNVSSLSGGGGMAGVINIKTKKSSSNNEEFSLKGNYGSYNFKKISSSAGFNLRNSTVYAVFAQQSSDNDFNYRIKKGNEWQTLKRKNNAKESSNAMLNISSKFKWFDFYYSGNFSSFNNELPGPTNFLDNYKGANIQGYDLYNDFKLKHTINRVKNSIELYFINKESNYRNLTSTNPISRADNESKNKRLGMKLQQIIDANKLQITLLNSSLRETYSYSDKINQTGNIDDTAQSSYASNIITQYEDEIDLFNYNLIGSLRYDNHNRFDSFVTYRISGDVSYDYIFKPTFLFSYGTSFTVPSFYSLYWKGDSQAVGNPDLYPEESKGYQLGLQVEYSTLTLKLNKSFNEIDNLIQWIQVQMQGGVWKPVNIGTSEITNYELEANWEIVPDFKLFSKAVISETKNKTRLEDGSQSSFYGKELVFIPDYRVNLGLDFTHKSYNIRVEYAMTGEQWTTRDNLIDPLPDYDLLNAGLAKVIKHRDFEHNLNINFNNILNNYYETIKYNPQAPFNWSLGYGLKYYIK